MRLDNINGKVIIMIRLKVITNRKLCRYNLEETVVNIIDRFSNSETFVIDSIVLREKDLSYDDYISLYRKIKKITCNHGIKLFAHNFYDDEIIDDGYIHFSMDRFREISSKIDISLFKEVGVSVHSIDEARFVKDMGGTYVNYGHIFNTDCKKGLEPRGLDRLYDLCSTVDIRVFAIGGINMYNVYEVMNNKSYGICMMSVLMRY